MVGTSPRDPCVDTGSVTAPFSGFPTICDGGVLASELAGQTNSEIMFSVQSYIVTRSEDGSWGELYANAFAWMAYDHGVPGATNYPGTAQVIANGFFKCTLAWGDAVYQHTGTPPSNPAGQSCGTNVPNGYLPAPPEAP